MKDLIAHWEARLSQMPDCAEQQRRERRLVMEFIASLRKDHLREVEAV